MYRIFRSHLLGGTAIATVVMTAAPAMAMTYDYNLEGGTFSVIQAINQSGGGGYSPVIYTPITIDTFNLTNSSDGTNSLPAITLSVGDTVTGTVALSSPMTVPASPEFGGVQLSLYQEQGAPDPLIFYNETVSFLNNGIAIPYPSVTISSSNFGVILGDSASQGTPTPSYTFNEIAFSATITNELFPPTRISSLDLTSGSPTLQLFFEPVPLPLPSLLMLSALGGLAGFCRRRALLGA
jgi:hypothetical protein